MTLVRLAAAATLLAAFSLSGCSEARRALGYDKSPPDEFAVVARAPLAQPPDFTLRPPTPGAPRPQEGTVRDQAKGLLVAGKTAGGGIAANGRSQGELVLLTKAGTDHADPDIRRKVNEETSALIEADDTFTNKVLFWRDKPVPGEPLDAVSEAKRLRGAATAPGTFDANAPKINRGQKGWLNGEF